MLYEGVTPDARYDHAFIDGARSYRVSRRRRADGPLHRVLGLCTGQTGLHPTQRARVGSLTEKELEVGADGRFEVVLSPDAPSRQLDPDPRRGRGASSSASTATDWSMRPTSAQLRDRLPIGVDGPRRPRSPSRRVEAGPRAHGGLHPARGSALLDGDLRVLARGHAVNQVVLPRRRRTSRTDITVPSAHRFACGYWDLAPDEALEIRFAARRRVPFWGLCLVSYWYEPVHWPEMRSNLNSANGRSASPTARCGSVVSDVRPPSAATGSISDGHRAGHRRLPLVAHGRADAGVRVPRREERGARVSTAIPRALRRGDRALRLDPALAHALPGPGVSAASSSSSRGSTQFVPLREQGPVSGEELAERLLRGPSDADHGPQARLLRAGGRLSLRRPRLALGPQPTRCPGPVRSPWRA